ncbi:NAD(P)/FAD-dependent oxidoreductase [Streptomyces enissocaesilis]|uniref:NAD(P)/FAD-dependent oxidoreductase n=1 Tax=Streptomyces enissocaesilis TaxID=332589 RepID=A0ABN3XQC4_9ACTN
MKQRVPVSVAVIGAGVSGLCMGLKLKAAGIEDFVIYEKADDIGGVWRDNTYPGLSCDVPSRTYSYSFAPNPQWSAYFSDGSEILQYLRTVAADHGLRPHLRTGTEVTKATFVGSRWILETSTGETREVDFLLCATGLLVQPTVPDLPGLDSFRGRLFHSARWDHSAPTAGQKIAVIGTGSTGVQLTCALTPQAQRLMLFQRTPQWVFPKPNKRISAVAKAAHRRWPVIARLTDPLWRLAFEKTVSQATVAPGWQRTLLTHGCRLVLRQIRSPDLRRRMTPDHPPLCKRLVVASGFHRAVQQPHVDVISTKIERITPHGIRTEDGHEHEADLIVLATGFRADAYMRPLHITGPDGHTLEQEWSRGPRGYRTVALPGFPNLFTLVGPNSPFSNEAVIRTAETQADYILKWLDLFTQGTISRTTPTREATDAFNTAVATALPATTFTGCTSWYQDQNGIPLVWPWPVREHRTLLSRIELADFHTLPGPHAAPTAQEQP